MVILEASFPSGYTADLEALKDLKKGIETIRRTETKNGDTVAVIYFDNLTKDRLNFMVSAIRTHEVSEQQPASILIYDYYDNGKSDEQFSPFLL